MGKGSKWGQVKEGVTGTGQVLWGLSGAALRIKEEWGTGQILRVPVARPASD
jgi:hypothetical protein